MVMTSFQFIEDGAVRPVIALAMLGEVAQRGGHGLEGAGLLLQRRHMVEGDAPDIGTGAVVVPPERQEATHILQREGQVAGMADEAQHRDIIGGIDAVAVRLPCRVQQADRLVMPDHLLRDTGGTGGFADIHRASPCRAGFQRASSSAFASTETEESAIAAPASIGER